MKSLRIPLLGAAFAGVASLASTHAMAAPYASFSDMEADWQRLSSPGTAWQSPQRNLTQAPADPIEHAATKNDRVARFQQEENAWQAESRSDNPPEQPPEQAQVTRGGARSASSQRMRDFADMERADQQLSTP
jgi:hypothetical protein